VTAGALRPEDRGVRNLNLKTGAPNEREAISPLRRRMLEDMAVRRLGEKAQSNYIRQIETFTLFLGRSPDTGTAEDVRRFQIHLTETGVGPSSINQAATAPRYFFDDPRSA
jgi:integrase/recombinase XerD